jgi:beta-phosphoglucomutase-like phosphatase (HAD superfamily)
MTGTAAGAVIFDMDGVLLDSGVHHRDAWRLLLEDIGVAPPPGFWRHTIGRPAEEAVVILLDRRLEPAEAAALARRKREHYARLAARGMLPVAGAPAFVAMLVSLGVPRAVATSATRADVDAMLTDIGVRAHFDVVVSADDVQWGKPNPEVYLRAAAGLGWPPAGCLVFEDAVVGVHAARNAGMRVIGVTTAHTARELLAAGAERAIADFEGFAWPV